MYRYGQVYRVVYIKQNINIDDKHTYENIKTKIKEENTAETRFKNSLSRSRSAIVELALCNDWDFFATFTLNKEKYDRMNLQKWRKDFTQYIRNNRKSTNEHIKYLLIPEHHRDGAWHFHGLMMGIRRETLQAFDIAKHPRKLVKAGYRFHAGILERFGFNSFAPIRDSLAVSVYVSKYVTKQTAKINLASGAHLYYASQGLERKKEIASGCTVKLLTKAAYENEYVIVSPWITDERTVGAVIAGLL
jgi:hypothetical protein